eukprot:6534965-Lingulodinium_polyedra.AAC.1
MAVSLPAGELHDAALACQGAGFAAMRPEQRRVLLDGFLRMTFAPEWMVQWSLDRWPYGDASGKQAVRSRTALFTYQAVWGVVAAEPYRP